MCGATDCPSCGPAQGYEVVRRYDWRLRRYVYVNPDPDDDDDEEDVLEDEREE
jgi:hypothetical protein